MTHICVDNLTIVGLDNGLSPGRRQAIIWTNGGILLIEPFGTNFSEFLIGIIKFSVKKMHLWMSSGNLRPCCLDLNELSHLQIVSSVACVEQLSTIFDSYTCWFVAKIYYQHCANPHLSLVSREIPRQPFAQAGLSLAPLNLWVVPNTNWQRAKRRLNIAVRYHWLHIDLQEGEKFATHSLTSIIRNVLLSMKLGN